MGPPFNVNVGTDVDGDGVRELVWAKRKISASLRCGIASPCSAKTIFDVLPGCILSLQVEVEKKEMYVCM